jgi:hypothetical protein
MLGRLLQRSLWKSLAILSVWLMPALACGAEKALPMRTWISADGKFHVVAKLAETQADSVVLEKEDGSRITVPRAKLSAGDLTYIDRQAAAPAAATGGDRAKPASTPAKEAISPATSIDNADSAKTVEESSDDRAKPDTGPAKADEQSEDKVAKPLAVAGADGKDTRLTLTDIERLRQQRITPEQVLENVAEQGRGFEVTAEVAGQLRNLGFGPAQIEAIKESSSDPLVPGKRLASKDERRNQVLKQIKQVAAKSGVAIEPIESQRVTLWAAKDMQPIYLPDVQKLEKYFHTKFAEPIRSGLDKRSTHLVLLKNHAEYEAWCRAMFDLFGEQFAIKGNPDYREEILKLSVFGSWYFSAISVGELPSDRARAHRNVATSEAGMYMSQLGAAQGCKFGPLQAGFVNCVEAALCGSPSYMSVTIDYHHETQIPSRERQAWSLLVQQRIATHQATPLGDLLQLDTSKMSQAQYAEAWMLVGLLTAQPAKYGELLTMMRKGGSEREAIEKVYGWDEKKLTAEWRAYVMRQGNKN